MAFFTTLIALGTKSVPSRISLADTRKLGLPTGTRNHIFYHKLSAILHPAPAPSFTRYTLTYHFSSARHWDDDNAIASPKAYRDGIAHALRIDDRLLTLATLPARLTDSKNPRLIITLLP